jgi:hypothetical protein
VLLTLPDVPVTVMVDVPAATVPAATSVIVPGLLAVADVNDAFTPFGKPAAAKTTVPLNPFCGLTVRELPALLPGVRLRLAGDAVNVKVGTVMVRPMLAVLFRAPEVPVTVTLTVAAVTELAAVSVSVLALIVLTGLKAAVTPLGRPVAARITLPLNPFSGLTVRVLVPLVPGVRLRLTADAERVKLGTAIVRPIVAVLLSVPETPVTVTVAVPPTAELAAVSVKVLEPLVLAGLKDAVTPFGRPVADRLTLALNPFAGVTVIVLVVLLPAETESVGVDEASVKLAAAGAELRSLIRDWPAGVPQPVARS